MKFICGVFIIALIVVLSNQSTPFTKCLKGQPPLDVRVKNCRKSPCLLYRGSNITAEWDFNVGNKTKTLKPRLRIGMTVNQTNINYPFPQANGCAGLKNASCPLEAGKNFTYRLELPVLKYYPKKPLAIEIAFLDDKSNVLVCFKLTGKVVDAIKELSQGTIGTWW